MYSGQGVGQVAGSTAASVHDGRAVHRRGLHDVRCGQRRRRCFGGVLASWRSILGCWGFGGCGLGIDGWYRVQRETDEFIENFELSIVLILIINDQSGTRCGCGRGTR